MTEWNVTRDGVAHTLSLTLDGMLLAGPEGRTIRRDRVVSISYPTNFSIRILESDGNATVVAFPSIANQRMFRAGLDEISARNVALTTDGHVVPPRESRTSVGTGPGAGPNGLVTLRRQLRAAIIENIESHQVSGERLAFNRVVGEQWFYDTEGEAVFNFLKGWLEDALCELQTEGSSSRALKLRALSLRLDCLDNMHASGTPGAIFEEEFELSAWYRSVKDVMDPDDEFSDREFADMQGHLLLQEACYMLELPGFLEFEPSHQKPETLERRLAAVESSNRRLRTVVVSALIGTVALALVAFSTERHWTKVDVPEQPETFRIETYKTGKLVVRDTGRSVCAVGQTWTGCIDAMTENYVNGCANGGRGSFSDSILYRITTLTKPSVRICDAHAAEIERMKRTASAGNVATLGSLGRLTTSPQKATRRVSNDDHRSAVTHEAVCYLGVIGECE